MLLLILDFDGHISLTLTHKRNLFQTPVTLSIICLAILSELFFLLEHGGAELVPREQLLIIGLVLVELLLETDLEACFKEVGLHHFWCLLYAERVKIGPGCLHPHLGHIFLGHNSFVVEGLELGSVLIYKGGWPLLLENLKCLILPYRLQRRVIGMHLRLSDLGHDPLLVNLLDAVAKLGSVSVILAR